MKLIAIVGDSPYGKILEEMIDQMTGRLKVVAKLDDRYHHKFIDSGMIYGPISEVDPLVTYGVKVVLAEEDNPARRNLADRLGLYPWNYATLIHKGASVAPGVPVGKGTVIMDGAVVGPGTQIGSHVIVGHASTLREQETVGDFSTVSMKGKRRGKAFLYKNMEDWTSA